MDQPPPSWSTRVKPAENAPQEQIRDLLAILKMHLDPPWYAWKAGDIRALVDRLDDGIEQYFAGHPPSRTPGTSV